MMITTTDDDNDDDDDDKLRRGRTICGVRVSSRLLQSEFQDEREREREREAAKRDKYAPAN